MKKYFYYTVLLILSCACHNNSSDLENDAKGKSHELEEVILVFKTHFDIGYTHLAREVVDYYRTDMIDKALELVDSSNFYPSQQRFTWILPGWPMSKIVEDWPGQTLEHKRRIIKAINEERFAVHGLPFTMHTESVELEDLVRGLGYSSQISREANIELPRDAKMTDVPCHTWILPTLLKNAGIDFLHLGCNPVYKKANTPLLFFWEGPDGSKLLTMHSQGYGSARNFGAGLMPPADWPYKTWLALIHTSDNQGPPTPKVIKNILEEAKKKLPGVNVHVGRLSDFSDAILKEVNAGAEVPVLRADMPDPWIHGVLANPVGEKLSNDVRPALAIAERLNTLLRSWNNGVPDLKDSLSKAYEQSLLYGEHTWGGSFGFIDLRHIYGEEWKQMLNNGLDDGYRRLEESWEEHHNYIESAEMIIRPSLENNLAALAKGVKTEGNRVVVFNPLPWSRSGMVKIKVENKKITALKPCDGEEVDVEQNGNVICFMANDIPAMGYKTFVPSEAVMQKSGDKFIVAEGIIENNFWKVTFDTNKGVISSLIDKKSGKEMVDLESGYAFGQMLYERFSQQECSDYIENSYDPEARHLGARELAARHDLPKDVPHKNASPEHFSMQMEKSKVKITTILKAKAGEAIPFDFRLRVTLYADEPWLDLEADIENKFPDTWPEAGWICLPLKVKNPNFRVGRIGSIVDPTKDFVKGSNHDMYYVNTGVSIFDNKGKGMTVIPRDHKLISLDRPGCMVFSSDMVPQKPNVFVNLWNNTWNTNFPMWIGGDWSSRVRLMAVDNYNAEFSLQTPALETQYPLMSAFFDGKAGTLPLSASGVELSRKGISVTAFGSNPDGKGTVLRMWELTGKQGTCIVTLPDGWHKVSEVQPVNLRGQIKGPPIKVKANKFKVNVDVFAPLSFVIY